MSEESDDELLAAVLDIARQLEAIHAKVAIVEALEDRIEKLEGKRIGPSILTAIGPLALLVEGVLRHHFIK